MKKKMIVEKGTKEKYASKAAMKKHESKESKSEKMKEMGKMGKKAMGKKMSKSC